MMTPKQTLLSQFAVIAKALAHPNRLELIEYVAQGESSVESLTKRSGLSTANTSQHLQQLRRAGLIVPRQIGKNVLYSLADDSVLELVSALHRTAERHLAEVQHITTTYLNDRDSLEAISREELMKRIARGSVTVLDVRPHEEFEAGHIPGAININLEELATKLGQFRKSRDIVAYCRGAYCVLSYEAVALLREKGFKVHRLEEGFPEWRHAGLPVEAV